MQMHVLFQNANRYPGLDRLWRPFGVAVQCGEPVYLLFTAMIGGPNQAIWAVPAAPGILAIFNSHQSRISSR